MGLDIRVLSSDALVEALSDVAALRVAVFRDWPYLYDGDLSYEQRYLANYTSANQAVVVGAFDGARLVGAATGMPLFLHDDDFSKAFANTNYDLSKLFYCAESVLLQPYRGQGVGHSFFDLRENAARQMGFEYSTFCAVRRPINHPARPTHYRPLDDFWRKRGYGPLTGVTSYFSWKDVGNAEETRKPLDFWIRSL